MASAPLVALYSFRYQIVETIFSVNVDLFTTFSVRYKIIFVLDRRSNVAEKSRFRESEPFPNKSKENNVL